MRLGRRVAAIGMVVSGALAALKIFAGLSGRSTAVVAGGLESFGDIFSSGLVLLALTLAAKPADDDHPCGHGRLEILTGLLIGLALTAGGALICYGSLQQIGQVHRIEPWVLWPLAVSFLAKGGLALFTAATSRARRCLPTRGTTRWTSSPRRSRCSPWDWRWTIRRAFSTRIIMAAQLSA